MYKECKALREVVDFFNLKDTQLNGQKRNIDCMQEEPDQIVNIQESLKKQESSETSTSVY